MFQAYLSKLTGEQKKIYDELALTRPKQSIKLNNIDTNIDINIDTNNIDTNTDSVMNVGGGLVMIQGRKVPNGLAGKKQTIKYCLKLK